MKTFTFFAATCSICLKIPSAPGMQARDARSRVIQGCVDEFHTGHLIGEAAIWHNRPEARKIRAVAKAGRGGGVTLFSRESVTPVTPASDE